MRLYKTVTQEDKDYLPPCKGEDPCLSTDGEGYFCTRDKGHEGDHAAHGSEDRQIVRWSR